MANTVKDESFKPDPVLIAAIRAAYVDPVGQDFWNEVAERTTFLESEPTPESPEVTPLSRKTK